MQPKLKPTSDRNKRKPSEHVSATKESQSGPLHQQTPPPPRKPDSASASKSFVCRTPQQARRELQQLQDSEGQRPASELQFTFVVELELLPPALHY